MTRYAELAAVRVDESRDVDGLAGANEAAGLAAWRARAYAVRRNPQGRGRAPSPVGDATLNRYGTTALVLSPAAEIWKVPATVLAV